MVNTHGGRREGAGRKPAKNARATHSYRATDDEYILINRFSHLVKNDPKKAKEILKSL